VFAPKKIILFQTWTNVAPEGLTHMVHRVKRLFWISALRLMRWIFFEVRVLSVLWPQNAAQKTSCALGSVLSDWKEMGSWNFAGSFLVLIQDLGILFSLIGQLVEPNFKFSWFNSIIY
jgi:hypothetical protein